MSNPVAFVLGAMMGGPMIVNRLDYQPKEDGKDELGVGLGMLQSGEHGLSRACGCKSHGISSPVRPCRPGVLAPRSGVHHGSARA